MTAMQTYWKNDIDDLLAHATDVLAAPQVRRGTLSASEAAHALVGIVSYVQKMHGFEAMQVACAELARRKTWDVMDMPLQPNGRVSDPVMLIAVVCHGLFEMAGVEHLRAALSFWATETDPSVWRRLFA